MTSVFAHISAIAAGLAVSIAGFIVLPRTPLKGLAFAVAVSLMGALLLTIARNFG
jgi:hypothetical protein